MNQKPLIGINTVVTINGHDCHVIKISKTGVTFLDSVTKEELFSDLKTVEDSV